MYNQFVPEKELRIKSIIRIPYLNRNILNIMRIRDKLKNNFNCLKRRNIFDQHLYNEFKINRNKVNIELKRLMKEWYEKRIKENF